MNNLTRDEAASRAALVDVASYDAHLDLTREDGFDSTTTITTKLGYEYRHQEIRQGLGWSGEDLRLEQHQVWGRLFSYDNGRVSLHYGGFKSIARGHRNETRSWSSGASWTFPPGTQQRYQLGLSVRYKKR